MRILHVGKYFPPTPGGIESFLGDLCAAQTRAGHQVAAVVHGDATNRRAAGATRLYRAKSYGELIYTPLSPSFPRVLQRALRDFRPDLVHVHVPNASAFWLLGSRPARALPWIVQWQSDVDVEGGPRRLRLLYRPYRILERALLRRAARIVCSSPDYLEASRALEPWRAKARVIPLGLDPARMASPEPAQDDAGPWRAGGGLRVLAVGRLAHYKGHRHLLEALRRLERVQLAVAGTGELERSLHALSERLGLEHRVYFLGRLSKARLNALMRQCDLLCLPSTARTESFGIVLLEAMAVSRPVVASDVPGSGMPWVVRDAGHGLLAAPEDPDSLAEALERMQDPALRRRLGRAGRVALEQRFHIDRVAERIDSLYREVLTAEGS